MPRTRPGWMIALATGFAVLTSGGLGIAQQPDREQEPSEQQQTDDDGSREEQQDRERQSDQDRQREQATQDEQESRERESDRQADNQNRSRRDDQPSQRDDQQSDRAGRQQQSQQRPQQGAILGVAVEESPTTGVLIREVLPGSAADQAGLRSGDYLLEIDGQRISSPQQFDNTLSQMQPDQRSTLTVWRGEQRQQIPVDFAAGQQAGFRGQFGQQPLSQSPGSQPDQGFQRGSQRQTQRRESQAWLGVLLSEEQEQQGVRVSQIYPSGPAARAGLRTGDIVTQVDETQVSSAQELADRIERRRAGEQIELTVLRGENEDVIEITLGDRSDFFGNAQFQAQFQDGGQFPQQSDQSGDFDQFAVPEHAMMLEQHRHLASQHQRIERLLLELRQEVQSLRQEVQALSGQGQQRGARAVPGLPQPPNDSAEAGQPGTRRRTLRPQFDEGAQEIENGAEQLQPRQPRPGTTQPLPTQPLPGSNTQPQPNQTIP